MTLFFMIILTIFSVLIKHELLHFKMNKKKINYIVLLILLIGTAIAIWNPDNWLESLFSHNC